MNRKLQINNEIFCNFDINDSTRWKLSYCCLFAVQSDEAVWMERPTRRHLVEAAVKNVKHLLSLRQVLMEKMMEEFIAGVDIYLMHVRDANDEEAKSYQVGQVFFS